MQNRFTHANARSVCVVGLGYIGLPTAAILADQGYRVFGVDVCQDIVDSVNRGEVHIHEPHLRDLVQRVVRDGRLTACNKPCEADVFMICVPTPLSGDSTPDVSYVEAAARAIRPCVMPGSIVILESTSPPGTTVSAILGLAIPDQLEIGQDVFVAYCPERVIPGRVLVEAVENDRIVGGITDACADMVKSFYETFVVGEVHTTDATTAEIVKLAENAYRDVNIAFANEMSMIADRFAADAFKIIELANRHPRVNILKPGPGVGGHCISVDPWFLADAAPSHSTLIRSARTVNNRKPAYVVEQICELIGDRDDLVVGCLGLTYKADVCDLRESPSLEIVRCLRALNVARVVACDDFVAPAKVPDIELLRLDALLAEADIVVLLTDHQVFLDIAEQDLQGKILLDTRGAWRNQASQSAGNTVAAQFKQSVAGVGASE